MIKHIFPYIFLLLSGTSNYLYIDLIHGTMHLKFERIWQNAIVSRIICFYIWNLKDVYSFKSLLKILGGKIRSDIK